MQAASDIFLGWLRVKELTGVSRDYYVRQLHDWKGGVDADTMLVPGATLYARICGATLARAHARWGDRIAIASYLGKGGALRPRDRRLRRRVRGSERARLRDVRRRRHVGAPRSGDRALASHAPPDRSTRSRRCARRGDGEWRGTHEAARQRLLPAGRAARARRASGRDPRRRGATARRRSDARGASGAAFAPTSLPARRCDSVTRRERPRDRRSRTTRFVSGGNAESLLARLSELVRTLTGRPGHDDRCSF